MEHIIKILILIILTTASIEDIKKKEINNYYILPLIILGIIKNNLKIEIIISFIFITLPFLILKIINDKFIGMGDIKLITALIFIYNTYDLLLTIIISLITIIIYKIYKKVENNIPYVPFITIGIFIIELKNILI